MWSLDNTGETPRSVVTHRENKCTGDDAAPFHVLSERKKTSLFYIPRVKIIIVTHHCDFLMKLGLEAGNVFESVDVKPDPSATWRHKRKEQLGKISQQNCISKSDKMHFFL